MSDNDFDLFDDIDFKALSDGLGFNQNKKKIINDEPSSRQRRILSKNKLKPKLKSSRLNTLPEVKLNVQQSVALDTAPAIPREEVLVKSPVKVMQKIFSWSFDFIVVCGISLFALMSIRFFLFKKFDMISTANVMSMLEFATFMFIATYFFYFSIFWKANKSTLGMNLMGLKLKSTVDDEISFTQTLARAFFSFIGFLSFGITNILGLTDSLSWTKIETN